MIYCNLKGGLGNMMFQIAATISIAKDKQTEASFPNLNPHLDYLNNETQHNPLLNYTKEYKTLNIFKDLKTLSPVKNINTVSYPFYYEQKEINDDVIIDGFFQTEKYFINKDNISKLFKVGNKLNEYLNNKYLNILNYHTTSIHVRRGDYLKFNNIHLPQDLKYYQESINITKQNTEKYLIFSDDIEWCKLKFQGNRFIFIENERDYVELYLMSLCKNNIISNSSFSWWGAWLNSNESKIIISPKQWFGEMIKEDDSDIIPENWKRI